MAQFPLLVFVIERIVRKNFGHRVIAATLCPLSKPLTNVRDHFKSIMRFLNTVEPASS
jgi:hypothetical protein